MSAQPVKRPRPKGIAVRPEAVAEARTLAGLSLAELAREAEVTKQSIHQVEHGLARPSLKTLQAIARATGRPLTYFLSDAAADDDPTRIVRHIYTTLAGIDRMLARREWKQAQASAESVLSEPVDHEVEAAALTALGQALVMQRDPEAALEHLERARTLHEQIGDPWGAVEAQDWHGVALFQLQDPGCLPELEQALERARALEPVLLPTVARILGHIAQVHNGRHAWRLAIRYYEEAAAASEQVRDLSEMARMYDGLSSAYMQLQQPTKAFAYSSKSLQLFSVEADLAGVYRAENNLGDLLLQQGDLDAAGRHLERALAGFQQLGVDRYGPGYVLANLGELEIRRGRPEAAVELLNQALDHGLRFGERVVEANARRLLGAAREAVGDRARADREFAAAISVLEQLDMPDRLRDAHMEFAAVLQRRGDLEGAVDHYRSAAEVSRSAALGMPAPVDLPLLGAIG